MQAILRLTPQRAFCVAFALHACLAGAALRNVPEEYPTIQSAVDAAAAHDTVLIAPGHYTETVSVPCRSVTIASAYALSFDSIDVANCVWLAPSGQRHLIALECAEIHLLNVQGVSFHGLLSGGGLELERSSISIDYCIFDSCQAAIGGALELSNSDARIDDCVFLHCWAASVGAIAFLDGVRAVFSGCIVRESEVGDPSGALFHFGRRSVFFHDLAVSSCSLPDERSLFELSGAVDTVSLTSCSIDSSAFARAFSQSNGLCQLFELRQSQFSRDIIRRGILSDEVTEIATAIVTECVFSQNHAEQGFGGVSAMLVGTGHFAEFEVVRNLFFENSWNDEMCLALNLVEGVSANRNYFIGNSSVPVVFRPCVIYAFGQAPGAFEHNVFLNNYVSAFETSPSSPPAVAVDNYWGDASGPFHVELNPSGQGDSIGSNIDFIPWAEDTLFGNTVVDRNIVTSFALGFPYPNPFNSSVTIEYALTREQGVRLEIFDVLGRKVATLIEATQSPGVHSVLWHANGQATGLYFARLSAPETQHTAQTVKLLLMK